MTIGPNRRAANRTLRGLRSSGLIRDEHRALVQAVCSLADAVDREPDSAPLWREYRLLLVDLGRLAQHDSDAFGDLLAELRAPLGHPAN